MAFEFLRKYFASGKNDEATSSREDAVPVCGDVLAQSVAWREKSLADLAAGDYMLRLHLQRATVYALRLVGP